MEFERQLVGSALLLLIAPVVLQSPVLQGQAQQVPGVTFQVEVNYVDVDVVVTDEHGQFVTGLTRNDFAVFGRRQTAEDRHVLARGPTG